MKINFKNLALYLSGILYVGAGLYASLATIFDFTHVKEVTLTVVVVGATVSGLVKLFTTGNLVDTDGNGIPDILEDKEKEDDN